MQGADHLVEARPKTRMPLEIAGLASRQVRGNRRVLDLVLRAGDDADPRYAVLLDRREQDYVVDANEVGSNLRQHPRQVALRIAGAVDDGRPTLLHVVIELVVRRLVEIGNVPVDEIFPEASHLLGRHRLGKIDRIRLKIIAAVDLDEAGIRQEHGLLARSRNRLRDRY